MRTIFRMLRRWIKNNYLLLTCNIKSKEKQKRDSRSCTVYNRFLCIYWLAIWWIYVLIWSIELKTMKWIYDIHSPRKSSNDRVSYSKLKEIRMVCLLGFMITDQNPFKRFLKASCNLPGPAVWKELQNYETVMLRSNRLCFWHFSDICV